MNQDYLKDLVTNNNNLIQQGIVKQIDGKYILNTRYKIGKIILKKNVAQFIDNDFQKIYIELDYLNGAYNEDIVLVQMIFNPRSKTKAKVIQVIQRNCSEILCCIKENKLFSVKEDIFIDIKCNTKEYQNNDIVLIKENLITQYLGNIKDAKVDEKISLYLYKQDYRSLVYDTNIVDEFKMSERVDLTHLPFCTIDPATAKDHDDAIYFEQSSNTLYVAIADVSAFIKEGSKLDIEAKRRAFSVYLPNKVLPMIPFSLSANLCSLKPNEKRLAYVFKMELDIKKLEVISSEVFEATIISSHKYSYEEIDIVLEKNSANFDSILALYKVTCRFRQRRLLNGFDFRTEELRLKLNEKEQLTSIVVETSSPSHQLIEECMLLANCQSAKKLKSLGIFRIHEEPSAKKMEKLIEDVQLLGLQVKLKSDIYKTIQSIQSKAINAQLEHEVDELIIKSQQQARYSVTKSEHFGLGFDDYSHFTSPIRRYADLVLHRILKTSKIPKDIEDTCEDISTKEREINSLVWDLEDRKYARWANENLNTICEAKIVDIDKKIAQVITPIKGLKVVCENYSGEKLFSKIKVKVIKSDILTKQTVAKIII